MNDTPESDPETKEKKPGPLLRAHRDTVRTSTGMSPAILLGSGFALAMGLFAWLGHQWDERNQTAPWGVLTGVALGLAYGVYEVWKLVKMAEQTETRENELRDGDESP